MMAGVTDAQKACIERQNCPQVQMPSMGERPEIGNPQAAGEKNTDATNDRGTTCRNGGSPGMPT